MRPKRRSPLTPAQPTMGPLIPTAPNPVHEGRGDGQGDFWTSRHLDKRHQSTVRSQCRDLMLTSGCRVQTADNARFPLDSPRGSPYSEGTSDVTARPVPSVDRSTREQEE